MKSGSVDSFGQNFSHETSGQSIHWLSLRSMLTGKIETTKLTVAFVTALRMLLTS